MNHRGDFQTGENTNTFLVVEEIGLFEFGVEYPLSSDRQIENNTYANFYTESDRLIKINL